MYCLLDFAPGRVGKFVDQFLEEFAAIEMPAGFYESREGVSVIGHGWASITTRDTRGNLRRCKSLL
jgi:hypothetical protein